MQGVFRPAIRKSCASAEECSRNVRAVAVSWELLRHRLAGRADFPIQLRLALFASVSLKECALRIALWSEARSRQDAPAAVPMREEIEGVVVADEAIVPAQACITNGHVNLLVIALHDRLADPCWASSLIELCSLKSLNPAPGRSFPEDATSGQQLFRQADQRLYKAKENGRNQVQV